MYYLFQIFCILLLGLFFRIEGHTILKEYLYSKYKRWSKLNKLVSTKYKGHLTIICISIKLLCQILYISLIQYLNNYLVKINKNDSSIEITKAMFLFHLIHKLETSKIIKQISAY